MPDDVADLRRDIQRIYEKLAELSVLIQTEASRCPFRESIHMSSENRTRLEQLEDEIHAIRVEMARMAALSGTAGGTVVGAIALVAKALGWF